MSMRQLYNRCKDKKNEDNNQTKCELFLKNIKILSIMDKKEMILAMIEHYCEGNKKRFANLLGISPQGLSTWISRQYIDIEKVYSKCDGLSAHWLITGEGPMFDKDVVSSVNDANSTSSVVENKLFKKVVEQAETIGILKERIRQLERDRGQNAQDVNTPIAHVG